MLSCAAWRGGDVHQDRPGGRATLRERAARGPSKRTLRRKGHEIVARYEALDASGSPPLSPSRPKRQSAR